jgi:hypothetical protein
MKFIFTTLYIILICNFNLFAQNSISKRILGIWRFNGNHGYLIFINDHSGAVTSNTRLLKYYFNYELGSGQPALITEHFPIFNDNQYTLRELVQMKDDSTLLINGEIKGKKALLMEGKKIATLKKLPDENIENFIRKPNQNNLIGTWISVFKKDTTTSFTFKSNNTVDINTANINKAVSTIYKVDFSKQPMRLDLIGPKGEILPNIVVFSSDSTLRLAGPKNGQRRSEFSFFGNNTFLKKKVD